MNNDIKENLESAPTIEPEVVIELENMPESIIYLRRTSRQTHPPSYLKDFHCNLIKEEPITSTAPYFFGKYLSYDTYSAPHKHYLLNVASFKNHFIIKPLNFKFREKPCLKNIRLWKEIRLRQWNHYPKSIPQLAENGYIKLNIFPIAQLIVIKHASLPKGTTRKKA